jgi:transposase-like protein
LLSHKLRLHYDARFSLNFITLSPILLINGRCLSSKWLRVFRGVSKYNLPGYVGFFQFLRNFRQHNAFEQAELILRAALDPTIARRARKGELDTCFDHFDLLQTAIH